MKITKYLIILLFPVSAAFSQTVNYAATGIADSIRAGAHSVIRLKNTEFEVTAPDRATMKVHEIVTILNDSGRNKLYFEVSTDKFHNLSSFDAALYDSTGKNIVKYKQKELQEFSIGENLIDDARNFYLKVHTQNLPATVEFNFTIQFKGLFTYPSFYILEPDEGVESASFTASVPNDIDLRYKEKNTNIEPTVLQDGDKKIYKWAVKNLTPFSIEEGAGAETRLYPYILMAPTSFRLDGYNGDMSSWKSLGTFYNELIKGIAELPEDRVEYFKQLTKDAKSDSEKVRIMYELLQKDFRYVSIRFGIGGLKPLPAKFTDAKKYGDCKGLCNYMQAVLTSLGIKSYVALVNADYNEEPVDPTFPYNGFDHVILCVPQQKDSIWLECTSRITDFNVLSGFTENRNVLLVTDSGGFLVPTPFSKASNNILSGYTTIDLQEDGSGKTSTVFNARGEFKEMVMALGDEKQTDQKESVFIFWGFKDPGEISLKSGNNPENELMTINQNLETIPEFKAGSKMFLAPRIYRISTHKLPKAEKRKQDYYFKYPFEKTDTTAIKIPPGYKVDTLPDSKNNRCSFASYTTKYWFNATNQTIYSTATLSLNQQKIPASSYKEVKTFFDNIQLDDQVRIVIVKN